jgi:hypothetical protein
MRSGFKELVRISAVKVSNNERSNGSSRFNPNHRLILVLLNSLAETEETCFQRLGHDSGCDRLRSVPGFMNWIVTWLILPVVICLSQRLSHACLSINKFIL